MNPRNRRWVLRLAGASLLLLQAPYAGAQPSRSIVGSPEQDAEADILSLGMDIVPSPSGGDFVAGYALLGAERGELPTLLIPGLRFRMVATEYFRLTFGAGYGGLRFTDVYGVVDSTLPGRADAFGAFVERFNASVVPVTVGAEYAPVHNQFTGYVGAAAGISVTRVEWITLTQHESSGSLARPELNINGVSPAFVGRVYWGLDYRFDAAVRRRSIFRGLYVEGSYLMMPVRRDFFVPVRRQGRALPATPPEDSATLQLGGVSVSIGLNLQFSRR